MKYIGFNETRYRTEDLERICAIFENLTMKPISDFCPEVGGHQWRLIGDRLPVGVGYWSPISKFVTDKRGLSTGTYTPPFARYREGPWFVRGATALGTDKLQILSPSRVEDYLSPLEALARTGDEETLPREAVVEILLFMAPYMGIHVTYTVGPTDLHRYGTAGELSPDALFEILTKLVNTLPDQMQVGITARRQDKGVPPTKTEKISRLLSTYTQGGAANGMEWKRWCIQEDVSAMFTFWEQREVQRKRLIKAGGEVKAAPAVHEMLRELADEYERKMKERE